MSLFGAAGTGIRRGAALRQVLERRRHRGLPLPLAPSGAAAAARHAGARAPFSSEGAPAGSPGHEEEESGSSSSGDGEPAAAAAAPAAPAPPPGGAETFWSPRASNPRRFQEGFQFRSPGPRSSAATNPRREAAAVPRPPGRTARSAPAAAAASGGFGGPRGQAPRPRLPPGATVADWILEAAWADASAAGRERLDERRAAPLTLPTSGWVRVDNIPPASSLEALVAGMRSALDRHGAIVDLDAPWNPAAGGGGGGLDGTTTHLVLPPLPAVRLDEAHPGGSWVERARVVLSPFARPTGWRVRLASRSLAHALLSSAQDGPLLCGSRPVTVRPMDAAEAEEAEGDEDDQEDGESGSLTRDGSRRRPQRRSGRPPEVSDATIRVENCSDRTSALELLNLFSRYDLRHPPREARITDPGVGRDDGPARSAESAWEAAASGGRESASVVRWTGVTSDGKVPPATWLVHFRNAGWARAAIRDVQGATLDGRVLRLARYPRQKGRVEAD